MKLESGDMGNKVQARKGLRQGQFVSNLTNFLCNIERTNPPKIQFVWTTQSQMLSTQQQILANLKH